MTSRFNRFVSKLKVEGYSSKSARKIAAVDGAKKIGWSAMEERSQAARARNES